MDDFLIKERDDTVFLLEKKSGLELSINFIEVIESVRGKKLANELLLKTLKGVDKEVEIFDLTAGLGRDAVLMLLKGFRVRLVEKNFYIYTLLKNALENLHNSKYEYLAERLSVVNADSFEYLKQQIFNKQEICYLDPMFPGNNKGALPKKNMQILQNLNMEDKQKDNAYEMVKKAQKYFKKVILKRPIKAVREGKENYIIEGKSIRFEVFLS